MHFNIIILRMTKDGGIIVLGNFVKYIPIHTT